MIRIVAGEHGGRRIVTPPGDSTRPSTERLRESIFAHLDAAVLDNGIHGQRVLDLFAGSGALALEALSRGAAHATLVESAPRALDAIVANIHALHVADTSTVVRGKLPASLGRLTDGPYSLVFADPPYDAGLLNPTVEALMRLPGLLADRAVLVLEHRRNDVIRPQPGLDFLSVRRAGDTEVTIARVNR